MFDDPHPTGPTTGPELFRLLADNVLDYAVFVIDAVRTVQTWSHGAERLFGYAEAEIIGRSADVLFTPEDRETGQPLREVEQALTEGRGEDDRWHVKKDGTRFWSAGVLTPLRDEAGQLHGFAKIMRDQTALKLAEEAGRRAEERLARDALLLANVRDAVIVTDLDGIVTYWNEGATGLFGWASEEMLGRHYADRFEEPVRSWIADQIRLRGEGVDWDGEFEDYRKDGSRVWIDSRVRLMRDETGRPIGVIGVSHDITARKRAEAVLRANDERLRESEDRLRLFVEHAPAAVAMLNADMRYVAASRRWSADFDLGGSDLRGRSHYEVFPNLPEHWREVHRRCLGGAVERAEEEAFTRPDGRTEWLRWEVRPWRDGRGHIGGIVIFSEVITGRKRAEREVREQAGALAGILAASVDHVYVVAADGRYLHVSAGGARALGLEPQDVVGRHWRDLSLPAEVMGPFDAQRDEVLRSGRPARREVSFAGAGGEERRFEYFVAPASLGGGPPDAVVVVSRDVTDRSQAEEALRESESRLRRIVDSNVVGLIVADFSGRLLDANDAFLRTVGYTQDDLRAGRLNFLDLTPPEYRPLDEAAMAEMTAAGRHSPYEKEYVRKDGSRVPVLVGTAYLGLDRDGNELGVGFIMDLSERMRAERSLRMSEERFRGLMDQAPFSVQILSADGRTVRTNRAWEELWGVTAEQIGDYDILEDPQLEAKGVLPHLRKAFAGEPVRLPEIAYDPNETIPDITRHEQAVRWVSAVAYPIKDAAGGVREVALVHEDVTARRKAEAGLRESEAWLRLALDAGRMGTWDWNVRTGRIRWSDGLEEIHGLAPGSFDGTFEAFQRLIHPDDLPALRAAIEGSLKNRTPYEADFRFVRPDGSAGWMAGRGRPSYDDAGEPVRMVGVGMEVTDRKRAESDTRFLADASAALADLADPASTLTKVAALAVPHFADWCSVDLLDGGAVRRVAVAHVDPAKVELAHDLHRRFPPDPAAPRGVWNILRSGEPELVPEITDELIEASVKEPERLRLVRELGLLSYVGVPLKVRGRVLGVLTFIAAESGRRYDERDRRVAEDLARRAAVALENARLYDELRDADRRKDEFLAMLAHELRNPLAPIRSGLDLLKMSQAEPEVVEVMSEQVGHVVRLVDDLLDVSRILRGKVELKKEATDLSAVLRRAVETVRPRVEEHRQRLVVSLPGEDMKLEADPVRLTQVAANLLNNASKYTDDGGEVRLEAERRDGEVVIRVSDTGIGIEPSLLPKVFDLFTQADQALDRSQGGLGIGLTVVKSLIEMHGGTVTATSEGVGRGSTFTVRLPAVRAEVEDGSQGETHAPARSCRILVVDDNAPAAKLLGRLLRKLGDHRVLAAHDGPTALAAAEEFRPDLVLLDIGLPRMDGYEVARRLRERPEFRDVLLVALTGYGTAEDRKRSVEAGFDDHLVKPPGVDLLRKVLAHPKLSPPESSPSPGP